MKFIKDLREKYGVLVVVEEAEKCLNDLCKQNKYKSVKVDKSLKNFNYMQHKQERANYECYKLVKSNAELLKQWACHFVEEFDAYGKLYSKDFGKAFVEIYVASMKTFAFTQENVCFLSNEYKRGLNNHINELTKWLDGLMNLIESLEKEE